MADRRSQEVLESSLASLSPAAIANLECKYKKTPYYIEGNRPYVPLWRCLAAAFLEPLLFLLRVNIRKDNAEQAQSLCDLYWKSCIELPLMPLSALEAMAAEHAAADPLVLKAVLAPTDGAPAHGDAVKLVLALLPRIAAANWRCSLH